MIEVYYVEDDEFIGNTVKEYLEEQSFHVLIYTTVEAARQALMKHVPSNGADDYVVNPFDLDVIGGLCFILALIGIANVFSNTLGFLRQRKREFAQYLSIGMTPAGIRKIFCIEAAVIAGRPILITIPLTVAAVGVMIKASYLDPMEFIAKAPVGPILAFCLIMAGFVALAYYLGGKKVMKCSLSEALRDDTLE